MESVYKGKKVAGFGFREKTSLTAREKYDKLNVYHIRELIYL